jgi:hypothetical protein
MQEMSRRGFLGWSAVGLAGLLLPSRTVVGPSVDIRQAERWEYSRIVQIAISNYGYDLCRPLNRVTIELKRPGLKPEIIGMPIVGLGQITFWIFPPHESILMPPGHHLCARFQKSTPGMAVEFMGIHPDGELFAMCGFSDKRLPNPYIDISPFRTPKASSADS